MKTLIFKIVSLITFMSILTGCQNISTELGDSEKESIVQEVKKEYEKFIAAASKHDAALMMDFQWNSEDYHFASNGTITKGYEAMNKVVNSIHLNPELQSYSIELNDVMIRVISPNAAIVSAESFLNNFPTREGPKSIKMYETVLMEKIDDKWVITVGHESTREDLENI